ncbi:Vmc-like lipoprotein signal peptide domain-containing protein [Erwinia sp. 198]
MLTGLSVIPAISSVATSCSPTKMRAVA